jgi:hypothetical protein
MCNNSIAIKLKDRKEIYLTKYHQNITINFSLLFSSAYFCGIIALPIYFVIRFYLMEIIYKRFVKMHG